MKATAEMRRVRFGFSDRLVLIPIELIASLKYLLPIAAATLVLAGLGADGYSLRRAVELGLQSVVVLVAGFLGGTVLAPALLPWLPGRAFSVKGAAVGVILAAGAVVWIWGSGNISHVIAWVLLLPAVASFLAMNFTGASTYTSLSGVRREMRIAVPLQLAGAAAGLGLWVTGLFA
jgi:acetyl-CoA decarbonylase/synthase complex subunit gamma